MAIWSESKFWFSDDLYDNIICDIETENYKPIEWYSDAPEFIPGCDCVLGLLDFSLMARMKIHTLILGGYEFTQEQNEIIHKTDTELLDNWMKFVRSIHYDLRRELSSFFVWMSNARELEKRYLENKPVTEDAIMKNMGNLFDDPRKNYDEIMLSIVCDGYDPVASYGDILRSILEDEYPERCLEKEINARMHIHTLRRGGYSFTPEQVLAIDNTDEELMNNRDLYVYGVHSLSFVDIYDFTLWLAVITKEEKSHLPNKSSSQSFSLGFFG